MKTQLEYKNHFKERLFERHGIEITDKQYNDLCSEFTVIIKTGTNKSFGYITINNHKIWCLRYMDNHTLVTVYSQNYDNCSVYEMIRVCIRRKARNHAYLLYQQYLNEWISAPKFENVKDAAIYFINNTEFKTLHIDHFVHGYVKKLKILRRIQKMTWNLSYNLLTNTQKSLTNERTTH